MRRKLQELFHKMTSQHPVLGALPIIVLALACAGGIGATSAMAAPTDSDPIWVISVDGQILGAAEDQATLNQLYEEVVESYDSEDVTSLQVLNNVVIASLEEPLTTDIPQDQAEILAALTEQVSVQTISQVTITEEIPYDTVTLEDDTIYEDESYTVEGHTGLREVVSSVISVNGVETLSKPVSSTVVVSPQDTQVYVGTLVRPEFIWPTHGAYTGSYGIDTINGANRKHTGIDIAAASGTAICAARGGTVVYAGWDSGGYGNLVVIQHDNGTHTYYGHNASILVSVGDYVEQGQQIATMGATGNVTGVHCHFEIRIGTFTGLYVASTVNPLDYLSLSDL